MHESIIGLRLRIILMSVQEVSGKQYPLLLQQAGLSRFLDHLPPADNTPVLTSEELAPLFGCAYTMLGEPLTRLFMRNTGTTTANVYLQSPLGQQLLAAAPKIPVAERLGWILRNSVAESTRTGVPLRLREDETCFYEEWDFCYMCAGIHGVHAPICAMREAFGRKLLTQIMGRRTRVEEVACRALGASCCSFAVWK
jgi:hypothetical protein